MWSVHLFFPQFSLFHIRTGQKLEVQNLWLKFPLRNQFGFFWPRTSAEAPERMQRLHASADARACEKVPILLEHPGMRGRSQQVLTLRNGMCAHFTKRQRAFIPPVYSFCARLKQANQEVNGPNLLVVPQDMCNVR